MNVSASGIMDSKIAKRIDDAGIIAVVVIDNVEHALPLATALLEGGVNTIELTLRTPEALEAAKIIKNQVQEINLGFGTVITLDQVNAVVDVGADFAVSPGCNPKIIAAARENGLSFAPGIMTPTDIEMAIEEGCKILKFFPAETSGGMKHLEGIVAPYQYLGLKFIPLGGVNFSNAEDYLKSPLISAIGGSWVAKRNLIQNEDWSTITKNASEITSLIKNIRG